jgi:uncharacterized protein (DUF736 family)
MTAIGYVRKENDGCYKGHLRTVSIQAKIDIVPNQQKTGETSGKEYVSLSIAAPEFGPKNLYVNLGRAAGSDEENLYAVIWNPGDLGHHAHAPHEQSCRASFYAISSKKSSLMRTECPQFFVFGGRVLDQ